MGVSIPSGAGDAACRTPADQAGPGHTRQEGPRRPVMPGFGLCVELESCQHVKSAFTVRFQPREHELAFSLLLNSVFI